MLIQPEEYDPRNPKRKYIWASPGFNLARRARLIRHLREKHPEDIRTFYPNVWLRTA